MKHLYLLLTGIIVVSLIACGKNSPNKSGLTPNGASATTNGTIDGGGGNALNNKMLESYIVKPEDLTGYELLVPLLDGLKAILNYQNVNSQEVDVEYYLFIQSVLDKPWYLIPANIQTITNDKIGAPFNDGTVQVAFQTFDAIWIDENAFNKLSSEDKAKLILHEIVMGLKILKFESDVNLYAAVQKPEYKPEPESVLYPERLELNITASDVAQVRTVTRKLWDHIENPKEKNGAFADGFTKHDFASMLVQHGFDRILYKDKKNQIGLYQVIAGVKVKDIDSMFAEATDEGNYLSSDYLPKKGSDKTVKAASDCSIKIKRVSDHTAEINVHIKPLTPETEYAKTLKERKLTYKVNVPNFLYYLRESEGYFFSNTNRQVELIGDNKDQNLKTVVTMHFNGDVFEGLSISERAIRSFTFEGSDHLVSRGSMVGEEIKCNKPVEVNFED